MRVLVSAYACDPNGGSEEGAGWEWARAAALNHEIWLLTRGKYQTALRTALAREPNLKIFPIYLDVPRLLRAADRASLGYLAWQYRAGHVARRLHRDIRFDLSHHLTLGSDWLPAAVVWIESLPAVWGPVGGIAQPPWRFWRWLGIRGLLYEVARECITRPARRIFGQPTSQRASVTIAQHSEVGTHFRRVRHLVVEPNVALDEQVIQSLVPRAPIDSERGAHEPFEKGRHPLGTGHHLSAHDSNEHVALFAGRLAPFKGLRLALDVLAHPTVSPQWVLHVLGAGPDLKRCQRAARRLGIEHRVVWLGQQPRSTVLTALARAEVLLLPSIHDSAPWIVGEAITLGVPVLCLDTNGPRTLMQWGSGAVVPSNGRIVDNFAAALEAIDGRAVPSDRLLSKRLPSFIDEVYTSAIRVERAKGRSIE
jgi:glycosyltransferase involved in cell wall biosynthesis